MEPGTYQVSQLPPSVWGNTVTSYCEDSLYTIELNEQQVQRDGVDFANDLSQKPILSVDVNANIRRYCFKGQTVVRFCNEGLAPAEQAKVRIRISGPCNPLDFKFPL